MEFLPGLLLAGVAFFILSKVYEGYRDGVSGADKRMHCMTCGTDAEAKEITKGSMGVEIALWLLLLIPGLIYSVWRMSSKQRGCSACGSTLIVPFDAPAAAAHRNSLKPH